MLLPKTQFPCTYSVGPLSEFMADKEGSCLPKHALSAICRGGGGRRLSRRTFFFSNLDTGSVVLPSWRKRQKDVLSFRVCAIGSHTMDGYGPEEGHQCVFSLFAS